MTVDFKSQAEFDVIRETERERLRALLEGNIEVARTLHADDFQLINPLGGTLSKEQYLGGVASGEINYLVWEPDAIAVRVYGEAALIRYQSELEIVVQGQKCRSNATGTRTHTKSGKGGGRLSGPRPRRYSSLPIPVTLFSRRFVVAAA